MLALSEDGDTWHPRYGCEEYEIKEDCVLSTWHPFAGVTVRTELRPYGEWHVRIHHITSDRDLYAAEGGYAISRDGCDGSVIYGQHAQTPLEVCENGQAAVIAPWGISGVMNLQGYDGQQNVMPEPNTNLMVPRTLIPTLTAKIGKGETVLVSAVFGTKTDGEEAWKNPPTEVLQYGKMG